MADAVRHRLNGSQPDIALILGSGLGDIAEAIEGAAVVPFEDIPEFPRPTVRGHAGRLVCGTLNASSVIALQGRLHMYEGHGPEMAGMPVRLMHALGAHTLFVSNAAGGIRRTLVPGDLMLIRDHINLMWCNPLAGPVQAGDLRFPDMSEPYDAELIRQMRIAARQVRIPLAEGVYAGLLGPAYETPAEVRMLERLGADAVGMSTVPEVIVARALGMRVAGLSCITNVASGMSGMPLSHAEVLETTERVRHEFMALVRAFVGMLRRAP
ncbi:MAG: purine-nucleoside phosphorylase [Anaerolineae bacterium]|nr:purine-nucleoside phosphorylase [Gemmatimonadaceae bacterium]